MYEHFHTDGTLLGSYERKANSDTSKPKESQTYINDFFQSANPDDPLFLSSASLEGGLYLSSLQKFTENCPKARSIIDKKCTFITRGAIDLVKETLIAYIDAHKNKKLKMDSDKVQMTDDTAVKKEHEFTTGNTTVPSSAINAKNSTEKINQISARNPIVTESPTEQDTKDTFSENSKNSLLQNKNPEENQVGNPDSYQNETMEQTTESGKLTLESEFFIKNETSQKNHPSKIMEVEFVPRIFAAECGKIDVNEVLYKIAHPTETTIFEAECNLISSVPVDLALAFSQYMENNQVSDTLQGTVDENLKTNLIDFETLLNMNDNESEKAKELIQQLKSRIAGLIANEAKNSFGLNQQRIYAQNQVNQRNSIIGQQQGFRPANIMQSFRPQQQMPQQQIIRPFQSSNLPFNQQQALLQQIQMNNNLLHQQQQMQQMMKRPNMVYQQSQAQSFQPQQLLNKQSINQNNKPQQALSSSQERFMTHQQQPVMPPQTSRGMQQHSLSMQLPMNLNQTQPAQIGSFATQSHPLSHQGQFIGSSVNIVNCIRCGAQMRQMFPNHVICQSCLHSS